MTKDLLLEICSRNTLQFYTETTPYGRGITVLLNDKELDSTRCDKRFENLNEWAEEVNEKILEGDNLDDFHCHVLHDDKGLFFQFEFDNSWLFTGQNGTHEIVPADLLPALPDLINQFEEFQGLELNEEDVLCSFTYERGLDEEPILEILDLWSEGPSAESFIQHLGIIEVLKIEINKLILQSFGKETLLSIVVNGDDITFNSIYKEEYAFEDIFEA